MCSNDFDTGGMWDDMDDLDAAPSKTVREEKFFPCISCSGTGKWTGGNAWNPVVRDCFACKGTGKRRATEAEQRNRKAGAAKARVTRENKIKAFREENAELIVKLFDMTDWNTFAASLISQLEDGKTWSEKQISAAENMIRKCEETRARKRAERDANLETVDVSRIREMFDTALENGKKKRALIAGNIKRDENGEPILDDEGKAQLETNDKIKLTPAREPRREIWVKVNGEFVGGIREGRLDAKIPEWVQRELKLIAKNPEREAKFFGQATGTCCMCAAELTNKVSIDRGIGPICAEKWLGG